MSDLPDLTRAEVVNVQPGDVIVLTFPDRLTMEAVDRIRHLAGERWPNNPVMVLTDGATATVHRPDRYREDPLLAAKRERLEQINAEDGALIDRIRR